VKTAKRDEQELHEGYCCEVLEQALDVGVRLLYDLGDVEVVHNLSEEVNRTGDFVH
jgi:hypothetical protein